jgi:hypothetical protein
MEALKQTFQRCKQQNRVRNCPAISAFLFPFPFAINTPSYCDHG